MISRAKNFLSKLRQWLAALRSVSRTAQEAGRAVAAVPQLNEHVTHIYQVLTQVREESNRLSILYEAATGRTAIVEQKAEILRQDSDDFSGLLAGMADRVGELEARLVDRAATLEARLENRVGALEARLEDRVGALEARLEDRVGAVEARLVDLVGTLEARLGERVGAIEARLGERVGAAEARLGGTADRVGAVEARLEGKVETRLGSMANRVGAVEARLGGKVETRLGSMADRVGDVEDRLGDMADRLAAMEDRLQLEQRLRILSDQNSAMRSRWDDLRRELLATTVASGGKKKPTIAPILGEATALFTRLIEQQRIVVAERDVLQTRNNVLVASVREVGRQDRTIRSERALPAAVPTFAIATPVLDGRAFLDETILSVVTQSGRFKVRYHVQDGGSSDGTLDVLERWSKRLSGSFPILCDGVEFTYASAPDAGLYDGINTAFDRCGPGDFMSWVNSDDRYEPGAFESVAQIFQKFEDVHWVGGRPVLVSDSGAQGQLVDLRGFPRKAISAGIFEGRFSPFFLQQEGMFWRYDLWSTVGGLDSGLRLAGDFDLWRRFAQQTDYVMADALFGCFRVREGQLSASIEDYLGEIDQRLTPEDKLERGEVAEAFRAATTPEAIREGGFCTRFAVNRVFAGGWHIVEQP